MVGLVQVQLQSRYGRVLAPIDRRWRIGSSYGGFLCILGIEAACRHGC